MENLLIYGSIFDTLDELSNEEAGLLFKALNSFRKGEEVEFEDRYLKGLWKGIKPNLDKLKENYDSKVKANQENGKKGGRPPKKLNDAIEPSKPSISTQVIPEVKKDIIVANIKDKLSIKASDIPRQPIQVKVLDVAAPVIENKVDSIDLSNLTAEEFHIKTNNNYSFANSKIFNPIIISIVTKVKTGEYTFQQAIAECEHLKNEYIKRDNKIKETV